MASTDFQKTWTFEIDGEERDLTVRFELDYVMVREDGLGRRACYNGADLSDLTVGDGKVADRNPTLAERAAVQGWVDDDNKFSEIAQEYLDNEEGL